MTAISRTGLSGLALRIAIIALAALMFGSPKAVHAAEAAALPAIEMAG
jgi:hypothetical protein